MSLSPTCQVQVNAPPWLSTAGGLDVVAGDTILIRLVDPTGVLEWYLEVTGTDETSTAPVLTGVNAMTHKVVTVGTEVSVTVPAGTGRAFLFESTVTGVGGPFATTFEIYVRTDKGDRVGATGETLEGDSNYGWASKVNALIRTRVLATVGGDLTGTLPNPTVLKLRGAAVPASPALGDVGKTLTVTGAGAYGLVTPVAPGVGGDLSGSLPNPSVIKLRGATLPASPLLTDVGKVLGVTAVGTYGLVTPAGSKSVPVLTGVAATAALVGAPEEIGGVYLNLSEYLWATTALFKVYLKTSDGAQTAHVDLYDADGAVNALPSSIVSVSSASPTGQHPQNAAPSLLLYLSLGGSGSGWFRLRAWNDGGGAVTTVLAAEIVFS